MGHQTSGPVGPLCKKARFGFGVSWDFFLDPWFVADMRLFVVCRGFGFDFLDFLGQWQAIASGY
jgi:hypothetical protein